MPLVVPNARLPLDDEGVDAVLHHVLDPVTGGRSIQPVLDQYPSALFKDNDHRAEVVIRDYIFLCPGRRAARASAKVQPSTYLYHFEYPGHWIDMQLMGDYHVCSN